MPVLPAVCSVFRSVSVGSYLGWRGFSLEKYRKKALQGGHPSGARCINKQKDTCISKGHLFMEKKHVRSIGGELQGSFYRITNCKRCILRITQN